MAADEEYACPGNGIPLGCEKELCRDRERCPCAERDLERDKKSLSTAYRRSND